MFLEWLRNFNNFWDQCEKPVLFWEITIFYLKRERKKSVVCEYSETWHKWLPKQFSSFCQMPQPLNCTHLSLLLYLFELMTIIVFLKLSCFAKWRHFFLHTCWLVFGTGIILVDLYSSVYWWTGLILDDGELGGE